MMRLILFLLLSFSVATSQLNGQHAKQLPATTIGSFSILNFKKWQSEFADSGVAAYFSDDAVQRMFAEIFESTSERNWLIEIVQTGIIREFAEGQLTFAVINEGKVQKHALILDCESNQHAKTCAEKIHQIAISNEKHVEAKAVKSTVFASNSRLLFQDMLNPAGKRLDSTATFRETVIKSSNEIQTANFWLFADPFAFFDNIDSAKDEESSISRTLEIAKTEGLGVVKAIGGCGEHKSSDSDSNFVGYVLAEQPFRRGMRMLSFANTPIVDPPQWAHGTFSSGFFHFQLESILESFSTVFDSIAGGGEDGVFLAVLNDLRGDPNGPKVNVETEIVANLETPVYFTTGKLNRSGQNSNQTVVGLRSKNDKSIVDALTRFYDGDPQADKLENQQFAAWNVRPLKGADAGIRTPYVVAVRNGFLLVGLDVASINQAFSIDAGSRAWKSRMLDQLPNGEACFGYQLNLEKFMELKHMQLKHANVDGVAGVLLKQLNLTEGVRRSDRSKWPEFSTVSKHFGSRIVMLGNSNSKGWKIVVEVVK